MPSDKVWQCMARSRSKVLTWLLIGICSTSCGVHVSGAVSFETTFLGDWLVEKTHDLSKFMRESGKEGDVAVIAAPLDQSVHKNAAFIFACVRNDFYLDIEIPPEMLPGFENTNNVVLKFDDLDMLSRNSNLYRSGFIENGMFKVPLLSGFFDYFLEHDPVTLNIDANGQKIMYYFKNKDNKNAIQALEKACSSNVNS